MKKCKCECVGLHHHLIHSNAAPMSEIVVRVRQKAKTAEGYVKILGVRNRYTRRISPWSELDPGGSMCLFLLTDVFGATTVFTT